MCVKLCHFYMYFLSSIHTPQHTHHTHHNTHHAHHNTHTHTTSPVGGNHSKDISCNPRPNEGDMVVCNSVWCATGGTSTKEVCTLPTEAQLKNQPYPFGLDPVSLRWDWGLASVNIIAKKQNLTCNNTSKIKVHNILLVN